MIAEMFYRVLGMAAWTNERLSRQSAYFIPANWIIFLALSAGLMTAFPELWDAYLNGTTTSMGNVWILAAIEGVMLICLLLFLITFCSRYVVFRKAAASVPSLAAVSAGSTPAATPSSEYLETFRDLHVTGQFVLDAQTAQRFLEVPAAAKIVETGDIALLSKINASLTMYETIMLKERVGIWYLMMKRTGLRSLEPGRLYFGLTARPALRVGYTDAISLQPASAIFTFIDDVQRRSFADALTWQLSKEVQFAENKT